MVVKGRWMTGFEEGDLPGVAVAGREAHEAVCEFVVVDEGAELAAEVGRIAHCSVPVSDDGLRDESGEVVVVLPAYAFDGNGNMSGGVGVVSNSYFGADEVGSRFLGGGTFERGVRRRLCW